MAERGAAGAATSKAPEQWGASDKLDAVIQAAGLSGPDLSAYCRERGLYPKQLARWRHAAEAGNSPSAPSMTVHRDLQRKNQEQARQIQRLEPELQKKEKAVSEASTLLLLSKARSALPARRGVLIPLEQRNKAMDFLYEGLNSGASTKLASPQEV